MNAAEPTPAVVSLRCPRRTYDVQVLDDDVPCPSCNDHAWIDIDRAYDGRYVYECDTCGLLATDHP